VKYDNEVTHAHVQNIIQHTTAADPIVEIGAQLHEVRSGEVAVPGVPLLRNSDFLCRNYRVAQNKTSHQTKCNLSTTDKDFSTTNFRFYKGNIFVCAFSPSLLLTS